MYVLNLCAKIILVQNYVNHRRSVIELLFYMYFLIDYYK